MLEKKFLISIFSIIVLFGIGLVFFYIFSAPYGDGLEKTMEIAGVTESEPIFQAPFDYGTNYITSLIVGCIGFFLVLCIFIIIGRTLRKKNETKHR
jgi:hypothetical protein